MVITFIIENGTTLYKYDIPNDTYTSVATLSGANSNYAYFSKSNDRIYIWSSRLFEYDIINHKITTLSTAISNCNGIFAVDDDIFILYNTTLNKYNISSDSIITLNPLPYQYLESGSILQVDKSNIYIFFGNNAPQKWINYHPASDSYTQLENLPFSFYEGGAVCIDNTIYLIGGATTPTKIKSMALSNKEYEKNSVIISQGTYYYGKTNLTELFSTEKAITPLKVGIKDVWFYGGNGLETDIPTYIGNGTQWVKFKN